MTRAEMLARMTSPELTGWLALSLVRGEEAEHQQDLADSGDGIVVEHGREQETDEDDGETE